MSTPLQRLRVIVAVALLTIAMLVAFAPRPALAHNAACPSEPILHSGSTVATFHGSNFQCTTPLSFNCGTNKVWLQLRSWGYGFTDSTGRFQVRTIQGDGSEKVWTSGQRETDHRGMRVNTGFQHLLFVRSDILDTNWSTGQHDLTIGCQSGGPSVTYFSW